MDEWGTGAVQQNGRPNWVLALDSANVAEAFHMFPRENRTEGGAAADVAVQDPNAARKLTKYKRESEVDLNIVESKIVRGTAEYIIPRCSINKAVEPALPVRGGLIKPPATTDEDGTENWDGLEWGRSATTTSA